MTDMIIPMLLNMIGRAGFDYLEKQEMDDETRAFCNKWRNVAETFSNIPSPTQLFGNDGKKN